MSSARFVLFISALTDFVISVGTALSAAMVATETVQMPNTAVVVLAVIGGVTMAARTVQQALKASPETIAGLRGDPPPEVTQQGNKVVTKMTVVAPERKPWFPISFKGKK